MVEQCFRKAEVGGSTPLSGSRKGVGANKAKVASSNLASGSAQIVKGRKNTTMKFREKMEKFEKKEEVTFSNEHER